MLDKPIPGQQIFEVIFEHHHAVMLLIEPESGWIIKANRAAVDYYGYRREALESMNIEQINTLDREEIEADRLLAAREKRNYFIFSHRLHTGEIRQVEVHSSPVIFEEHPVLFSVIHDITDRQQALSELAQSEDRYHSLVEHIANGVAVFRPEGGNFVLLDINKAGERLIQRPRASLLGGKVTHIFPELHQFGLLAELRLAHNSGQPREMPKTHYQEGALALWLKNYLYPLPNGEIVVIFEDLTDTTELQQALDRSRNTLADILDTMDAVVYVTDMESYELLYVNDYTRKLTGAIAGDICWQVLQEGLNEPCEFCINPVVLKQREKGAEPHQWEHFNPKTERWFSFTDSAICWSDGRPVRLVVGYDISYLKKTEFALRESEERFELAMLGANDGLFDWDLITDAVFYSPQWKAMLGYRERELKNNLDSWQCLVSPNHAEVFRQMLQGYMQGKHDNFQLELQMRHKKGHWVDVLCRAYLVRDGQGIPVRVVGTQTDITGRKSAEEALLSAQQRQVLALEMGCAFAFEWDTDTDQVVHSATSMEILGLTDRQLESYGLADFFKRIHAKDLPLVQQHLDGLAPGAETFRCQYRYRRDDGKWIVLNDSARGFFDDQGSLKRLVGISADVTDREKALEEIKRYQYIASATDDMMAFVDGNYLYLTVNEACSGIFNRSRQEIIGKHAAELWGEALFHKQVKGYLDQALAGNQATFQHQIKRLKAERVFLDMRFYPYRDGSGSVTGAVMHGRDVTRELRDANALRMNEERLNALVELYRKAPELAEKEILAFATETVKTITRSHLGYLLFVSDDGESLSFESCSKAAYREDELCFKSHYPVSEVALWAETVAQCRPVIRNDMPSGENRAGPPVEQLSAHHMTVPVIEKDAVRILLGVANRQQHYDRDDVRQVKLIGETVWQLIRRKRAEQQLKQSAIVFETTREAVIITDEDARILAVNRAFMEITGYTESEAINRNPNILKSGRYDQEFYEKMWREITTEGQWHGEIWNRRKSGEIYPEWLSINSVLDDKGEVVNYIGVFSDISHIKHSEEQLHHLAHYDPLTDLPNRLQLSNQLASSVGRANRLGHQLALLFIDLDHFKMINDSLGHPSGDRVLQMVAERLRNRLRKEDFLARLGGDEFVILLEDCKRLDDAAYVAQDIINAMQKPFVLEGVQEIYLGSSIGISLYPDDSSETVELVRNADTAMYRAKAEGRNTYRFYTEAMTRAASERLVMESNLRRAIEQHELCVYYQPLLLVSTQQIIGFEALVRWQSPEEGLISPDRFIPVAEESGLISAIGDWVLENACCEVMAWRKLGVDPGVLSVNLSSRQFHNRMLTKKISRIMQRSGIRAEQLEFEITESVLMELTDTTVNNLKELETLGVQISIDDFGTGYSSLAYLKRFNIKKLKIDQAFIKGVPGDSSDVEITSTIIAMAKNLHIQVLAEGVENQRQLAFLQGQACDHYQGYYFAKPLPGDEALQLLQSIRQASAPDSSDKSELK